MEYLANEHFHRDMILWIDVCDGNISVHLLLELATIIVYNKKNVCLIFKMISGFNC